jgi:hypothetical protein
MGNELVPGTHQEITHADFVPDIDVEILRCPCIEDDLIWVQDCGQGLIGVSKDAE